MPCDDHTHYKKRNFSQCSGCRMCPPVDFILPGSHISRNIKPKYYELSLPERQPCTHRMSAQRGDRINISELNTNYENDQDNCWYHSNNYFY